MLDRGCIRELLQFGMSLGTGGARSREPAALPSWKLVLFTAKPEEQTETERWHLAFRQVGLMERDIIVKATECLNSMIMT